MSTLKIAVQRQAEKAWCSGWGRGVCTLYCVLLWATHLAFLRLVWRVGWRGCLLRAAVSVGGGCHHRGRAEQRGSWGQGATVPLPRWSPHVSHWHCFGNFSHRSTKIKVTEPATRNLDCTHFCFYQGYVIFSVWSTAGNTKTSLGELRQCFRPWALCQSGGICSIPFVQMHSQTSCLTDLCFFPSVLEGSYLRVQIYPLIPTKTSTLSQNQFHLPGIEWPHQASSSSSSHSRHHRRHRPHSRSPGRKWAAPLWTVWAAPAAPMTAVTGRIRGATSTLPLCSAGPQTLRTEKALP